ncbi:MAG TPA: aquaporin [Saprospiraceae bacterium]|nr:aquaporin [Saprospiraceae bacterium]HMP24013.1 aquaporin [Saprospiraceae bacterium]
MIKALQKNWRIYLIEAWALGMFMVSAALFTILLEHPALPLRSLIASAFWRRFFIGLAMGLTAIFLIYSTWGKRSGAHMNPAVTLAFLQLDRIRPADAAWYILAQFAGGTIAVLLFKWLAFDLIAAPEVNFAVTVPGQSGIWPALGLEMLLSFLLLGMVLVLSNHRTLAPYTGYFVGGLLVVYITFEAPFSGMSINPARTFASAFAANMWTGWWLYFVGPAAAMSLSAFLYRRWYRWQHHGNCLSMDGHMSGEKHDNATYEVLGPKHLLQAQSSKEKYHESYY